MAVHILSPGTRTKNLSSDISWRHSPLSNAVVHFSKEKRNPNALREDKRTRKTIDPAGRLWYHELLAKESDISGQPSCPLPEPEIQWHKIAKFTEEGPGCRLLAYNN